MLMTDISRHFGLCQTGLEVHAFAYGPVIGPIKTNEVRLSRLVASFAFEACYCAGPLQTSVTQMEALVGGGTGMPRSSISIFKNASVSG